MTHLGLGGALLLTPAKYEDERGFFSEVYNRRSLAQVGIHDAFVQDNHSLSLDPGTIRGLHFQVDPNPVAKLIRVTRGAIFDVLVDLRHGSDTYGQHTNIDLTAENWSQIYVPVGFAHGYCTLEPLTEVAYKVTDYWSTEVDKGVAWDDPDLGIEWPVDIDAAIVSDKDRAQPAISELPEYFQCEQP